MVASGDFGFWRHVAQSRTATCASAASREKGYVASLWYDDASGESAVLFEEIVLC